jgi:hypothetical protein
MDMTGEGLILGLIAAPAIVFFLGVAWLAWDEHWGRR